jgi:uncharacterized protein (TIGR02996 family)
VTESELVADVIAAPDDDAPRLVYADWLQERGDPRGELIALQCELVRADAADEPPGRTRPLREQVRALIAAHHDAWLGPLFEIAAGYYELRRGFVEHLALMQRDVDAAALHAAAPLLRELVLAREYVDELPPCAAALRLEYVSIQARELPDLIRMLAAPALASVRRLDIAHCCEGHIADLAGLPLPFEHVGLHFAAWFEEASVLARWLAHPARSALRTLALGPVTTFDPALLAPLAGLRKLRLTARLADPPALARALPQLVGLHLVDCHLGLKVFPLVRALPQLRHLRIVASGVGDSAAHAIARAAPQLVRLDLTRNQVTTDGARRVIELLPNLVELRLRDNPIDADRLDGVRVERADQLELIL